MFSLWFNPLTQIRFINWFLKGGENASATETKATVENTRRRLRIALIGLIISLLVIFFLFAGLSIFVMGTNGNG